MISQINVSQCEDHFYCALQKKYNISYIEILYIKIIIVVGISKKVELILRSLSLFLASIHFFMSNFRLLRSITRLADVQGKSLRKFARFY